MISQVRAAKYITTAVQIGLICVLLKSSVTISVSWTTVLCLVSLALTFAISRHKGSSQCTIRFHDKTAELDNPFKGKNGPGYLSEQRESEIAKAVADSVLYDAANVESVANFSVIKYNTECAFAKKSKVWGSPDYVNSLSLEENIRRLVPTFYKFTMAFQELDLDAFVIELPGKPYGENIQIFGNAVRSVLLTLRQSDVWRQQQAHLQKLDAFNDDYSEKHMRLSDLDTAKWSRRSWVFEFNQVTFFITTFAPFYPETNSRYAFGSEQCYILFQPELSFAIHNLPPDTAETNWTQPATVRDRIRVAFRDAGRPYEEPMKQRQPMVCEIIKPVHPLDECTQWWLPEFNKRKECD